MHQRLAPGTTGWRAVHHRSAPCLPVLTRVRRRPNVPVIDFLALSEPRSTRTAGPIKTYALRFPPAVGDGIRIVGPPGGTSYFTSIAELEVYSGG